MCIKVLICKFSISVMTFLSVGIRKMLVSQDKLTSGPSSTISWKRSHRSGIILFEMLRRFYYIICAWGLLCWKTLGYCFVLNFGYILITVLQ